MILLEKLGYERFHFKQSILPLLLTVLGQSEDFWIQAKFTIPD